MQFRYVFALATLVALSACDRGPDAPVVPVVPERYITLADTAMNIDSVASYTLENGETWLFATAKEGHVIRIFDAASGRHLRDFGSPGSGPGQFQRPNGIVVADDLLVVVERDNQRVQLFALPALEHLASFGTDYLEKPYGAYAEPLGNSSWRLFVTDAYETADEQVPPAAELDRRVHEFDLSVRRAASGAIATAEATHRRSFGATEGAGVLRVVESIWGDPSADRLLIAEEDPAGGRVIKVYSFDGQFTGRVIGDGVFLSQPEGITLYDCADDSGYWITTDQAEGRNVFHLFDRHTLEHIGGFEGQATRNTDGIWLNQAAITGFPAGVLFAVHDDQAVAAFDWRDVATTLGLPPYCDPAPDPEPARAGAHSPNAPASGRS